MSFIYENPWLLEELLKAGGDFENKFLKKGQAAPSAQPNPVADSLKSLIVNLRSQITGEKEGPGEMFPSNATDLNSQNMDSMGDFVEWLDKMGRKNIVVRSDAGRTNRPNENFSLWKIEPGTEIIARLQQQDRTPVAYWINTNALKEYLVALQGDPKLKGNVMFQVQLLKLVQDANKQLDLEIGEQYQETVDDKKEVDRLPKILDPQHPRVRGNDIPLFYKDIKSTAAFHAWLGSSKIAVKSDKNPNGSAIGDEDFDQCAIINILYQRAMAIASLYVEESKVWSAAYVKQMIQIAAEAKCTLSGVPGQSGQSGQGSQISPQALQQLASLRPFDSQRIKFQEIKLFVEKYAQLAKRTDIDQLVVDVNKGITEATKRLGGSTAPFPIDNLSTAIVKSWTNEPLPLLNALWTTIDYAGRVYSDFYEQFKKIMGPEAAQPVEQQITSGGPQQQNIGTIMRVRNNLMSQLPGGR